MSPQLLIASVRAAGARNVRLNPLSGDDKPTKSLQDHAKSMFASHKNDCPAIRPHRVSNHPSGQPAPVGMTAQEGTKT